MNNLTADSSTCLAEELISINGLRKSQRPPWPRQAVKEMLAGKRSTTLSAHLRAIQFVSRPTRNRRKPLLYSSQSMLKYSEPHSMTAIARRIRAIAASRVARLSPVTPSLACRQSRSWSFNASRSRSMNNTCISETPALSPGWHHL